jgi:hypothetical protein
MKLPDEDVIFYLGKLRSEFIHTKEHLKKTEKRYVNVRAISGLLKDNAEIWNKYYISAIT